MQQETIQSDSAKITKDMVIADILSLYPNKAMLISEILMDFGVHCVGCGASGFETLEEGVLSHGFTEQELDQLVIDLNKAVVLETLEIKNIEDFSLTLTDKAVKKLREIMKEENKENSYLRANVLAGGCSGYSYDLELSEEKTKEDIELEQNGVKILVSQESAEYLNGTKIDFIDSLNESGFKFSNPNATKECGCGKSFS
ncbi:MAG: iron-sulfur cluster assembly accessory protein [Nanoarchaeota archaeon]|mgnify:CR=1 FL=1